MDALRRCGGLALVGALAAVALAAGGCKKKVEADLVLVSPHSKQIEAEFERDFRAWHKEKFGADVTVQWVDVGGSTACTQYLIRRYGRADTSGIDLYFGGGGPDHKLLTAKGLTVPVTLPTDVLAAIPATITGVRQYDPQGRWHGAAVSCFGILYNAKLLKDHNIPIPKTWSDLAAPAMFGRIAAADATQSGSARAAYEMIIQSAANWLVGWEKLLKIFANCKRFTGGASEVVRDVANGEVLAGAAIDFYAYGQIALAGDVLGFTLVRGTTAFTPDPICLLKGAPHPEMARRFIEYVFTARAQKLWCLPAGAPDGPKTHPLYRQPIRRDVYEKCAGRMLPMLVNPFEFTPNFRLDEAKAGIRISRLLGPLMKAAAKDSRTQLSAAYKAILDAGSPADLRRQFAALPPDLASEDIALKTAKRLTDPAEADEITAKWQRYFRTKYEDIIAKAKK